MSVYETIDDVKAANEAAGQFLFSPAALRFWGSRISRRIYPVSTGAYFVTSEEGPNGGYRRYAVRFCSGTTGRVSPVSEFRQYKSASEAHGAARRFAGKTN